jgi:hypothetical protein
MCSYVWVPGEEEGAGEVRAARARRSGGRSGGRGRPAHRHQLRQHHLLAEQRGNHRQIVLHTHTKLEDAVF